jgi:hypothetical protein
MAQKIKTVRFHQAVQIGSTPMTYLTPDSYRSTPGGVPFSKIELEGQLGVRVSLEKEDVIISWTNIAYLVLDKEEEPTKSSKKS